ncbi:MAG: hypothetical protein IJG94_03500 [Clostridia bacterium]|nr:hypothetical protein [Clostridia bacterium]
MKFVKSKAITFMMVLVLVFQLISVSAFAEEKKIAAPSQSLMSAKTAESVIEMMGYYKAAIANPEGADVYGSLEEDTEPIAHFETKQIVWVKPANADWYEVYNEDQEDEMVYIRVSDVKDLTADGEYIVIAEAFPEIEFIWETEDHTFGQPAHMRAVLDEYETQPYLLQWQISPDGENWTDIENETGEEMPIVITRDNYKNRWQVVIRLLEPIENS